MDFSASRLSQKGFLSLDFHSPNARCPRDDFYILYNRKIKDNRKIQSEFNHYFGGQSWRIDDAHPIFGGPTLLLTLDLADPRLEALALEGIPELPLCSYINCDIWTGKQEFKMQPDSRIVRLVSRSDAREAPDPEIMLPNPLIGQPHDLREMEKREYLVDEDSYWRACDGFIGGSSFIRVLGPPLWLQGSEKVNCSCGAGATYAACIGYEFSENLSGFIENEPLFLYMQALPDTESDFAADSGVMQ